MARGSPLAGCSQPAWGFASRNLHRLEHLATHFLGEAPRPLNINRATNVELESVAGLTRKEAAAVLACLDKVGVCKSLDGLKKVPGLDYKMIDARKDFIVCFEASPPPKEPKKRP